MQPPPEPLNIQKLRQLISQADLIAVGKIISVTQSEYLKGGERMTAVSAVLSVEKLLTGRELSDHTITIHETYPAPDLLKPPSASMQRDKGAPEKAIVGLRAGPSCYHGRYEQGDRIIVFLVAIEGTGEYKPFGSGTYDKHLCEFVIQKDGIEAFYFRFADDLLPHVGSEDDFIDLIRALIDSK